MDLISVIDGFIFNILSSKLIFGALFHFFKLIILRFPLYLKGPSSTSYYILVYLLESFKL